MVLRALYLLVAGAIGGLIAYIVMEPSAPAQFEDPRWEKWEFLFSLAMGSFIGAALGLTYGMFSGGKKVALLGVIGGAIIGAFGGPFGLAIGGMIAHAMFGDVMRSSLGLINPARIVAFIPFGAIVGLVFGVTSRSMARMRNGLIGGALGGALAGALFDPIGLVVGTTIVQTTGRNEVGNVSRAVAAVVIGAGIGFFVGLVELVTRQAWVRLVLGKNEGKEYLIDRANTMIGRSEMADIPLYGDPNVVPVHAVIQRHGHQYILADAGSPLGTGLNGVRIAQAQLNPGDVIQISGFTLQFLTRAGRAQQLTKENLRAMNANAPGPTMNAANAQWPQQPQAHIPAQTMQAQSMPPNPQAGDLLTHQVTHVAVAALPTCLVAMTPPIAGQRFQIGAAAEAGRDATDISLAFDSMASRKHARFSTGAAGMSLQDLGSTNGTFVNGVRISEQLLKLGDIVQIGASKFRVE